MNATLEQIKPETIDLIGKNAERFGLSIDDYLRSLLPKEENSLALAKDKDEDFKTEERKVKRQKSIEWIKNHRQEYGGLFVALDGDQLICTGKKYGDVYNLSIEKGYKNAFIGNVLPLDYEGYYGGLD
jgi:hypothetical protein